MANYYAWSNLMNGGTVKKVEMRDGSTRRVVSKRNMVPAGEKVTKKGLDISDEEWDALIDGGSVRPYPMPEGASPYVSPIRAALSRALNARGEIDPRMLLTQAHPVVLQDEAEEQGDVPVGV